MEDVMITGPFGPVDEDDPRFQAVKEAQERAHAEAEDFSNRVWELFNGLGTESLTTLSQLLHSYTQVSTPFMDINYSLGQITAILKLKYDVCPGCGKDHTKDLTNWTPPPVPEVAPNLPQSTTHQPEVMEWMSLAEVMPQPADSKPAPKPVGPVLADASLMRAEMMQKYRVREGSGDGRVQCTDCGIMYPNLEDRMLRQPDTCHGCNLKSAHG